ncbi:MAG: ribonuclease [Clostridia bacterium]|nr:ribonuclease [Clostridia bacterium]
MNYSNMKAKEINTYLNNLPIDELEREINILKNDMRPSVIKLVTKYSKTLDRHFKEVERIHQLSRYENELYEKGIRYIAGVDEAGRGPLAGPVFAAAVVLPPNTYIEGINDSKKLSERKREELYEIIISKALAYNITSVTEKEIDEINIRNAAHKAMLEAINSLKVRPDHALIDGDEIKGMFLPCTAIVKGDSLSISIAAASILAKVTRDRYIKKFDSIYPQYGFGKHKGYGTKEHIQAIKTYGLCPIHRKSFTSKFVSI